MGHSAAPERFIKALQHEHIPCADSACPGAVEIVDLSQLHDRVKLFELTCQKCGRRDRLTGRPSLTPPWDDAALLVMADEHLMHQQPTCPHDNTPVVFTSLPNPRRKARYRLSCFYCGRQAEMDWPPPESRR
ncbi:MAG TPA: hypothetical protein VJ692_04220 [Nitrospiraceae bacterium]|nr:hypothetical protein [Nitrospiraceae bacterium]